ncbi:hypothetical protein C8F04DRAFT_1201967 [Mycena alexandri]|uniref:Alpha-type protein kinase domain-containing protein n=1 Tax=Mycena alexandri TaxID=1745969 RepID=A0AAD6RYA5_9AGAR|nr:hypothetical protein C8F04DRAFT_1201967 [Mycena alexandri]
MAQPVQQAPNPDPKVWNATFTPADQRVCGRPGCGHLERPEEVLTYLQPAREGQVGRWVCPQCLAYYQNKSTSFSTVRRESAPLDPAHVESVRKQVAAAQRNLGSQPVAHVGASQGGVLPAPPNGIQAPMAPPLGFGGGGFGAWQPAPNATPRTNPYEARFAPPTSSTPYYTPTPLARSGYTQNHAGYVPERARRAQQAYSSHGGYATLVEARFCYMTEGNPKSKFIGLLEVIQDVPLHIGAVELKQLLFDKLLPKWHEFTAGRPLRLEDFALRDDKWLEMAPPMGLPDTDCISAKCFTSTKNGAPQFRPKKVVMLLQLKLELALQVLDERRARADEAAFQAEMADQRRLEEQQVAHGFSASAAAPPPILTRRKKKGKGKAGAPALFYPTATSGASGSGSGSARLRPLSPSDFVTPPASIIGTSAFEIVVGKKHSRDGSTTPPPNKRTQLPNSPGSPLTREKLQAIVQNQRGATQADLAGIFQMTALSGVLHHGKTYPRLRDLRLMDGGWQTCCEADGTPVTIALSTAVEGRMLGSFKTAVHGRITPAFHGSSEVVIKQGYYASKDLKIAGKETVTHQILYDSGRQVKILIMEIRCLAWGHVLMELVYTFIDTFLARRQLKTAPFPIPRFQFVNAALVIVQNEFFLVETRIAGEFRKYINNRAAKGLEFEDPADTIRADFLCFAQHVQYQETFKMVFVSDFQGNEAYLTDPQILSDPTSGEGRQLFADGNVSKGFLNFETDHRCNAFCKFFELRADFKAETGSASIDGTRAMDISTGA